MISPYAAFKVRGGGELLVAVQNEREWERFATEVLEKPELVAHEKFNSNEKRVENQQALDEQINAVFSTLEREELEARLLIFHPLFVAVVLPGAHGKRLGGIRLHVWQYDRLAGLPPDAL